MQKFLQQTILAKHMRISLALINHQVTSHDSRKLIVSLASQAPLECFGDRCIESSSISFDKNHWTFWFHFCLAAHLKATRHIHSKAQNQLQNASNTHVNAWNNMTLTARSMKLSKMMELIMNHPACQNARTATSFKHIN